MPRSPVVKYLRMGEAERWTLLPPCETSVEAAKARGNPIEIKSDPGVYHAFDSPKAHQTKTRSSRCRFPSL